MNFDELFDELDLDSDGAMSRSDLHGAAIRLGWQWQEASTYALLDLLSLNGPLSRERFNSVMTRISRDPQGPYGEALKEAACLAPASTACVSVNPVLGDDLGDADYRDNSAREPAAAVISHLESFAGAEAGCHYRTLLDELSGSSMTFPGAASALLLIDPQRSFTCGAWLQSLGTDAEREALPIRKAFDNCARLLRGPARGVEKMFTRCPFPPDSYDWDERVASIIGSDHPYFIKPVNSVLWPPSNGFAEWVESLIGRGRKTLIMGGCTLNSCVRVSALDVQRQFSHRGLKVVVVLSLSGARTSNYLRSPWFGGVSAVELAVRDMVAAGVTVLPHVIWE